MCREGFVDLGLIGSGKVSMIYCIECILLVSRIYVKDNKIFNIKIHLYIYIHTLILIHTLYNICKVVRKFNK